MGLDRPMYYDRQGRPVPRPEGLQLFEKSDRRVAFDTLDDADVSTVHLVLDHAFEGPPLIFETMIFGGLYNEYQWRYSTEDEALAGHERIVAALREGKEPE